jgi:isocitrate lyase
VDTATLGGHTRPYSAEDVVKLRGSVNPECTLAQLGADRLWRLLHGESKKGYVNSLGALTGGQALQQAKAGIEAIYLSGWQVAADANLAASMYPDQSLYPVNSVPSVVDRINNTFRRADQIQWAAAWSRTISALCGLFSADRGRCGGGLWRRAERL